LDQLPWVEIDGDLERAFEEFVAAADAQQAENTGMVAVMVQPVDEQFVDQGIADFEAMLCAQEVPLVRSQQDADALRELMRRPPPSRRPLPEPLPLDE
jgi:hypothetical protein